MQSPQAAELINKLLETPNDDLHEALAQVQNWKWPRSDMNAWIKVLDKFDAILEEVIRDYDIDHLQLNVFTPLTKKTVCEILRFERLLLENSTNRKTYNSYDVSALTFTFGHMRPGLWMRVGGLDGWAGWRRDPVMDVRGSRCARDPCVRSTA